MKYVAVVILVFCFKISCPQNLGEIWQVLHWFDPIDDTNSVGTDYFNICNQTNLNVPTNNFGYQYARTGYGYIGISTYYTYVYHREYAEIRLSSSLIAEKEYCLEYYVSLGDRVGYAIVELGAFFSTDSITASTHEALPYIPQIQNMNNIISDTASWVKLSGSFIASGGEVFLTIGNFNNDANTTFVNINNLALDFSYYYIDDVSVFLCDDTIPKPAELKIPNIFTPNNDEWNNQFIVENLPEGASVQIYNRWGALVTEWNTPNGAWNGRLKGGSEASAGVYYCIVKLPDGEIKSSFVHLIR